MKMIQLSYENGPRPLSSRLPSQPGRFRRSTQPRNADFQARLDGWQCWRKDQQHGVGELVMDIARAAREGLRVNLCLPRSFHRGMARRMCRSARPRLWSHTTRRRFAKRTRVFEPGSCRRKSLPANAQRAPWCKAVKYRFVLR